MADKKKEDAEKQRKKILDAARPKPGLTRRGGSRTLDKDGKLVTGISTRKDPPSKPETGGDK